MDDPELHPAVPDDFDRRADQGMWTTQYEREGQYPSPESPPAEEAAKPKRSVRIPVRGSIQLQIADNDRTAQDEHQRMDEESAMQREVTEEERLTGAEQARKWLEDHK